LRVGVLEVDPGGAGQVAPETAARSEACHRIEVLGADSGAGPEPLYRFTASAADAADDADFAVNQLEVLWQNGLIRAIRIRAEDSPAPTALLEWIGLRRIPVVLEGGASAQGAWDALRPHEATRPDGPEGKADRRFPVLPRTAEDLAAQGFVIVEPGKLPAQESVQAKEFWSGYESRSWYRRRKPWARMLRELVEELRPASVLEFGCNVGRNLLAMQGAVPGMRLVGIDINAEAIREGRQATGLDLRHGDETMLRDFGDGEFDMVFTVSVLDHLAEAEPTCAALLRCARKWACFLEVRLPVEGKVLRHFDHKLGRVSDSTGASYSWHLERCLRGHPRVERLLERPCYLHSASLGPYYRWYHATLRP
jgi:SAM-dependent methyltransferase